MQSHEVQGKSRKVSTADVPPVSAELAYTLAVDSSKGHVVKLLCWTIDMNKLTSFHSTVYVTHL